MLGGPLAVFDFADEFGFHPVGVRGVYPRHGLGERAVRAAEPFEPPVEVAQDGFAEPGADVAGVAQPAVLVYAEQQGADHATAAARPWRPATDDDLL